MLPLRPARNRINCTELIRSPPDFCHADWRASSGTLNPAMSRIKGFLLGLVLAGSLVPCASTQAGKPGKPALPSTKAGPQAGGSPLLEAMQQELDRAMARLGKADPPPYFISYAAREQSATTIVASQGALLASGSRHDRLADISVRVGTPNLDNTHDENRAGGVIATTLPLEDRPDVIARVLWL